MKKFFSEFKAFAMRGNVLDLAVGVIIGGAFSAITTSLINDILMPLIGIIVGSAIFSASPGSPPPVPTSMTLFPARSAQVSSAMLSRKWSAAASSSPSMAVRLKRRLASLKASKYAR